MSQTSRTSGWRSENSLYELLGACVRGIDYYAHQTTKDVYNTMAATTTVRMMPGTRPKIEYEYGKDMIARQMYSENRRAAI